MSRWWQILSVGTGAIAYDKGTTTNGPGNGVCTSGRGLIDWIGVD